MSQSLGMTEDEIRQIEEDVAAGDYDDRDLNRLFKAVWTQRRVLRTLFNKFHHEPLRVVSTTDPIPNSELVYLKELVGMDDGREGM